MNSRKQNYLNSQKPYTRSAPILAVGALSTSLLASCLFTSAPIARADGAAPTETTTTAPQNLPSPGADMKATVDKVVQVVEKLPGESNRPERRTKLREIIEPRFNFAEMAKRSLGPAWRDITEDQQKEFVTIFSSLLARTYLNRIETVTANMVKVENESIDFPRAMVKTSVKSKGDVFPIDYRLMYENDMWRVYDVIIENIGLVANYRNEFAGIIRKEQFAGLMTRLREKQGD